MNRTIVLAGGSGFLGRILGRHFRANGDVVRVLTRNPDRVVGNQESVIWDGRTPGPWDQILEEADVLINLSGQSVNCRYHARNRAEILTSRIDSTRALGLALASCHRPPPVWLNASSATIYRHAEDRAMDETTGELGTGFSVDVCRQWEEAVDKHAPPGIRTVKLRAAMVFGVGSGGVFEAFSRIIRLRLGGTLGPGTQYVSWLHERDFIRSIEWILDRPNLSGPINLCAPHPLTNRDFMCAMRTALSVPIGLPASRWMLEIGAWALRTETELLLKSRRVVPGRLMESGFTFTHPELTSALAALTTTRSA